MLALGELENLEDGEALEVAHSPASLWSPIPIRQPLHLPRLLWITVLSISAALAVALLVQRCVGRLRQTRGAARAARPTLVFRTHGGGRRLSEADKAYCDAEASDSRGVAGAVGAEGEGNAQATGDTVPNSRMSQSSQRVELDGQYEDETTQSGFGCLPFFQILIDAVRGLFYSRAHESAKDPAESASKNTETFLGASSEDHSGRAGRSSKSERVRAEERAKRNKPLSSAETRRRLELLREAKRKKGVDLSSFGYMSRKDLLRFVKPRVMRRDESLAEFLALGLDPELVKEEKIRRALYYDQLALAERDRLYEHRLWLREQGAGAGWDEATGDDDVFKEEFTV